MLTAITYTRLSRVVSSNVAVPVDNFEDIDEKVPI